MRDKKTDNELLSDIHEGFEASGKHLSDDFLNDENLFADRENADIKHRKISRFYVTAACTAAAAVALVAAVNRFTDRDRMFTAELSENENTVQTAVVSEVPDEKIFTEYSEKTRTSAATEPENEKNYETGAVTEVFEDRTETSEMKKPAPAVTKITLQTNSAVKPLETVAVTEIKPVKPSDVTETESPSVPTEFPVLTIPEQREEDVTIPKDMENDSPEIFIPEGLPERPKDTETESPVTVPVYVPDSEKTERVICFVLNNTATEECVRPAAVYEDDRFIYTVRDPDSFLVSVKYSLTGKEFLYTLDEAVRSGEFTISELAEAGLPNCVISPK